MNQNKIHINCYLRYVFILTLLCAVTFSYGQLKPNFKASQTEACAPVLIQFSDLSSGSPDKWKWDLGNGTVSSLPNPSVTYFNPGKYTIKLVVQNTAGADSVVKENYIVIHAAPVADFTALTTTGCTPLTVAFTDKSIPVNDSIVKWEWDLGDGKLSLSRNAAYTYTNTGNYNITLKVTNNFGCVASVRKKEFIKTNGISTAFTASDVSTCTEARASFKNNSAGTGSLRFKWTLGDGKTSTEETFIHTYLQKGDYTVKLYAENDFGCRDSLIKSVQLMPQVTAEFSSDKIFSCTVPADVEFKSKQVTGNNYLWDFGDSTISELPNPVHTYKDTGSYTVKLIVANSKGCIDSVIKDAYFRAGKLNLALTNLPDSNCIGFRKRFEAENYSGDSIVSYLWNFGDGQTSTAARPLHAYTKEGYYTVSLIAQGASGCRDSIVIPNAIKTDTKPSADFEAGVRIACAKQEINFKDLSTGYPNGWEWYFSDGSTSAEQNPVAKLVDTGFVDVMMIAKRGGCADTAFKKKYIYINPPVSNFKIKYNCSNPYLFLFESLATGADQYLWDFGDGTSSTEKNPQHTYTSLGQFNVTLTVFNKITGCEHWKTRGVLVKSLIPDFDATDTTICKNDTAVFQSSVNSEDVSRYIWDFGDGNISVQRAAKITHAYTRPGVYDVMLTVVNIASACKDSIVKRNYIRVNGPAADFSVSPACTGVNNPVDFTDLSVGDSVNPIAERSWNFGQGESAEITNTKFDHVYTQPGLYYPSLKVTDVAGCADVFQQPVPVVITQMQLKFDVAKAVVCPGSKVKFYAQPFDNLLQYDWNFGDGIVYTGINPEHIYEREGTYDVKLIITDGNGNKDSLLRKNFIKAEAPFSNFTVTDSFRYCPPLNVKFTGNAVNAVSSVWDFGDGTFTENENPSHFYSLPGVYATRFIVTGVGGCTHESTRNIIINGPSGSVNYDSTAACKPYTALFTAKSQNAVSYIWDFNDGNTLAGTDTIVNHTYTDAGNYRPKLILIDDKGCKVPVTGPKEIKIAGIHAEFTPLAKPVCDSNKVYFTNGSFAENDVIKNYQWNFGDGAVSAELHPVHTYLSDGKFIPQLITVTETGCTDTFTVAPVAITLAPQVDIKTSPNGCVPLTVQVNPEVIQKDAADLQWNWSFGNGSKSALQNPPAQLYRQAGQYDVLLTVTGKNGCIKTLSKTVEAFASPVIRSSNDTAVCQGSSVALRATGADQFKWTAGSQVQGRNGTILAMPDSSTAYIVKGTNTNGCSASDTVLVQVYQKIKINYSGRQSLCKGETKKLYADGANSYSWYPARGLNNTTIAAPTAQPDSSTNYRVIGADKNGCFKDTGYVYVKVHAAPTADAGMDKTITAGETIDLVPVVSEDVTEVNWYPTSAIFRNMENGITVKPEQTTEYTLEVKNSGGCRARDKVQVFVICNGGNVFIPNTFSPNADGSNDVFYIRGKGVFKIKSLRIFGRWGQEVFVKTDFNANDPSAGWDGTFKGTKLQSDVFVYMAEVVCSSNSSVLMFKGNVALMR
ncbi:MAG: PKD domain-containing protein [Ferruginibacter sp.]